MKKIISILIRKEVRETAAGSGSAFLLGVRLFTDKSN